MNTEVSIVFCSSRLLQYYCCEHEERVVAAASLRLHRKLLAFRPVLTQQNSSKNDDLINSSKRSKHKLCVL